MPKTIIHFPLRSDQEARKIIAEIKKMLLDQQIWCTFSEEYKPDLKLIRFEGCIKVEK